MRLMIVLVVLALLAPAVMAEAPHPQAPWVMAFRWVVADATSGSAADAVAPAGNVAETPAVEAQAVEAQAVEAPPDAATADAAAEPRAAAEAETAIETGRVVSTEEVCDALAAAAQANELPVGFFARLIWQESRFIASAVSRAGAQGVAQFMPRVAAEIGLADPFDPLQALPKSAQFLRALRREFGNLGLAAAAYNAGAARIKGWLERRARLPKQIRDRAKLPRETQTYVLNITGHAPERWIAGAPGDVEYTVPARLPCREMIEAERPKPAETDMRGTKAAGGDAGNVGAVPLPRARAALAQVHGVKLRQRAAQAHPAAPPPPPPGAAKPWGVQVAAHFSEDKALQGFAGLRQKYPGLLANRKPSIVRTRLAGKGAVVNRIQIAMDTRAGAEQLCSQLRNAGGACLVLQN